jgi:HemY protein
MLRFFINILLICAAALLISTQEGSVALEYGDQLIEFDVQTGMALLLILLVWWWSVAKLWFFIKYGFSRRHEKRLRLQQQQGLVALTRSMNALASNDMAQVQKSLKKARRWLGDEPLVLWLEAELAGRRGHDMAAYKLYQSLAAVPDAAVLGWRGLLKQSTQHGTADTLRLTQQALAAPDVAKQDFAHELRILTFAQNNQWPEAILALHAAERAGALAKRRAQRLDAVLTLKHSQNLSIDNPEAAVRQLRQAYKLAPDLAPLVDHYARVLHRQDDRSAALKVLSAAWLVAPQLELVETYQAVADAKDPLHALQMFERFALKRKDHPATHIALGRLALAADIIGKARSHAEQSLAARPTHEGFVLLAAVEQAEHGDSSVAERDARTALPIGAYVCDACGHSGPVWAALCPDCGKVATLAWHDSKAGAVIR